MNYSPLNRLPIEIVHEICEYLDVYEILELKFVCKKIYFIIKEFKLKELIFNFSDNCSKDVWFFTNRPFNFKYNLDDSKLFLLKSHLDNLVINLKRLKIRQIDDASCISLENVNRFVQLEQLDVVLINCKRKENRRLSLVKLRTLSIKLSSSALEINTPALIAFHLNNSSSIHSLENIKFDFCPLSVKYLKIFTYHELVDSIFSSLEYLECYRSNYLNSSILTALPNLKELKIQHVCKSNLIEVMSRRATLGRDDLKVFYKGIEFTDTANLREFKDQLTFPLQMVNFDLLDKNLNWLNNICFNDLISLTDKIPEDFFKVYTNILEIKVSRLNDEDEFVHFIRDCQNLEKLSVYNAAFSQQHFYDKLPVISSLIYLNIFEEETEIDFSFLSRMFYLADIRTDQEMKIDKSLKLNQLNRLKIISFRINNHNIHVNKKERDKFYINNPGKYRLPNRGFSFDDLVKWCDYLKN